MTTTFRTITPIDGTVYVERSFPTEAEIEACLENAVGAFAGWKATALADRIELLRAMTRHIESNKASHAEELTHQMGRPIAQTPWEIGGYVQRANTMLDLAPEALANVALSDQPGFERSLQRVPLGLVLALAPWNYPWLTAVNAVIPALAAGNVVVLKHSDQTPLVAERMLEAARAVGIPEGVFSILHCSHPQIAKLVRDPRVDFVTFTGSVEGGRAVHTALGGTFKAVGLELGGKDPVYVREDADLEHAIPNLIEGVCFNSGQSCCGTERIYVARRHFDHFVEAFVAGARAYVLGDPRDQATSLGPMARSRGADHVRRQVAAAVAAGARRHIPSSVFPSAASAGHYLAPQVLTGVDHSMDIMREETFGPVVGIMPVDSDEEALRLMNDSRFGLTAAVWTSDRDAAAALADRLECGTVFMNRCDYLDPELAWVGVKDSGRGCTLSRVGFESLTRPKSLHFRLSTGDLS